MEKYGYGATMTVAEASELLGTDQATVRFLVRQGVDWGICIEKPNCERRKYIIFTAKLLDTLGIGGGDA